MSFEDLWLSGEELIYQSTVSSLKTVHGRREDDAVGSHRPEMAVDGKGRR